MVDVDQISNSLAQTRSKFEFKIRQSLQPSKRVSYIKREESDFQKKLQHKQNKLAKINPAKKLKRDFNQKKSADVQTQIFRQTLQAQKES